MVSTQVWGDSGQFTADSRENSICTESSLPSGEPGLSPDGPAGLRRVPPAVPGACCARSLDVLTEVGPGTLTPRHPALRGPSPIPSSDPVCPGGRRCWLRRRSCLKGAGLSSVSQSASPDPGAAWPAPRRLPAAVLLSGQWPDARGAGGRGAGLGPCSRWPGRETAVFLTQMFTKPRRLPPQERPPPRPGSGPQETPRRPGSQLRAPSWVWGLQGQSARASRPLSTGAAPQTAASGGRCRERLCALKYDSSDAAVLVPRATLRGATDLDRA